MAAFLSLVSCGEPEVPATTPGGGMNIQTYFTTSTFGLGNPVGNVQIIMDYVKDKQFNNYYAAGSDTAAVQAYTDAGSHYNNSAKRTPAYWTVVWGQNGAQPQCWGAFDNDF